jgi:hypothetical protein
MSATPLRRIHIRAVSRPTVADLAKLVTYATSLAGIYLSVGFLFYFAAKEKLIDNGGTMPTGLRAEFMAPCSPAHRATTRPGFSSD